MSNSKYYKKLINESYPKSTALEDAGIVGSSISKLLGYAALNTPRLPKIGKFLKKRIRSDIAKKRPGHVVTSFHILDQLLPVCALNLALLSDHVTTVVLLGLEHKNEHYKLAAANTFGIFADFQDEHSLVHKLDVFVSQLVTLSVTPVHAGVACEKLRAAGLRALYKLIQLQQTQIGNKLSIIVPAVLQNMQFQSKVPSAGITAAAAAASSVTAKDEENVPNVARTVLALLAETADAASMSTLLQPIIQSVEQRETHLSGSFPEECLKILASSMQAPYGYLLITSILNQVEHSPAAASLIQLLPVALVSLRAPVGPSLPLLLSSVVRVLQSSLGAGTSQAMATLNAKDCATVTKYVLASMEPLAARCQNATQTAEMLTLLVVRHAAATHAGFREALVECIASTTKHLSDLHDMASEEHVSASWTRSPFQPLYPLSTSSDDGHRVVTQRVFQCVVYPHKLTLETARTRIQGSSRNLLDRLRDHFTSHGAASHVDHALGEQEAQMFHHYLFKSALMLNNDPEHYTELFHTLEVMLYVFGASAVAHAVPILLRLQSLAETSDLGASRARSLHTVVLAYILLVAVLFDSRPLQDYARRILSARRSANELCPYWETGGSIPQPHLQPPALDGNDRVNRTAPRVTNLIDVDDLAPLLVSIFESGEDLSPTALARFRSEYDENNLGKSQRRYSLPSAHDVSSNDKELTDPVDTDPGTAMRSNADLALLYECSLESTGSSSRAKVTEAAAPRVVKSPWDRTETLRIDTTPNEGQRARTLSLQLSPRPPDPEGPVRRPDLSSVTTAPLLASASRRVAYRATGSETIVSATRGYHDLVKESRDASEERFTEVHSLFAALPSESRFEDDLDLSTLSPTCSLVVQQPDLSALFRPRTEGTGSARTT